MGELKKFSILANPNKDTKEENKGINKVFNVFWFIFVGLFSVVENAILGALLCCTIIGIPAGITCFKIIPLLLKPAGRRVQLNYGKNPVLNTFTFIFGGLENYIIYCILGMILCITIIGIPLGRQLFKIGKFYLAPYGSEIHLDGTFTEKRDTVYDMRLLFNNLYEDPDKKIKTSEGELAAADAFTKSIGNLSKKDTQKAIFGASRVYKYASGDGTTLNSFPEIIASNILYLLILTGMIALMIFLVPHILNAIYSATGAEYNAVTFKDNLFLNLALHLFGVAVAVIKFINDIPNFFHIRKLHQIYVKNWINLTTYYPNQTKIPTKRSTVEEEGKYITDIFNKYKPQIDIKQDKKEK